MRGTSANPRLYTSKCLALAQDGKTELVQAASTSIHNAHGQWIENVHLQSYTSEEHFWTELYDKQYSKVLTKAEEFLQETGGSGDDVLFFISCGMDACEHEYPSMSRHNRKVPTSYYYRFARDACALADKYAGGRLISVLEGGYSDRALISGAMAHFVGLTDVPEGDWKVDERWWAVENLVEVRLREAPSDRSTNITILVGESHQEATRWPPFTPCTWRKADMDRAHAEHLRNPR